MVVCTDGDVGFDVSTVLQQFGTTHPDPLWMARLYPHLMPNPATEEDEENPDSQAQ